MVPETPAQRLIYARTLAGYSSASEAARANKWNENTYRSHENGERGLRWAVITKYAFAFKVPASYIMDGWGKNNTFMVPIAGLINAAGAAWFYEDIIEGRKKSKIAGLLIEIRRDTFGVAIDEGSPPPGFMPNSLLICSKDQYSIEDSIESLCLIRYDTDKFVATIPASGDTDKSIRIVTAAMTSAIIQPDAIWGVSLVVPPRQWKAFDPGSANR